MKKSLSFFLSLVLFVTALIPAGLFPANASTETILNNGSFEGLAGNHLLFNPSNYSDEQQWLMHTSDKSAVETASWAKLSIIANHATYVRTGTGALRSTSPTRWVTTSVTLEANTTYTASFYYTYLRNSNFPDSDMTYITYGFFSSTATGGLIEAVGKTAATVTESLDETFLSGTWRKAEITFTTGANVAGMRFGYTYSDTDGTNYNKNTLYVDDMEIVEVINKETLITNGLNTAYNSLAALRAANQGTNIAKNGLRIYNSISKELIDTLHIVEFGTLARRAEMLNGQALTFESLGTLKPGIAYQNSQPVSLWAENDTHYIYTAYLTGIAMHHYAKDYAFCTYAKDADGHIYYGNEVFLSVYDVAHSIDQGNSGDGGAPTHYDTLAFQTFAKAADDFDAYANWLLENKISGGTLSGIGDTVTVALGEAVNGFAYSSVVAENNLAQSGRSIHLVSTPKVPNAAFLGWFDENEQLISNEPSFSYLVTEAVTLTAKYDHTAPVADTLEGDALRTALLTDGDYAPFFRNSIINTGNSALVGAVYDKVIAGEDITVVGFGGSITQGSSASSGNSYGQLVANALDKLGSGTVTYRNAGIGATSSVYGVARMGDDVLSYEPDLVLLDFSTNDQDAYDYAYAYEAVLRTLSSKQIATVAILYGSRVPSTTNGILRRENRLHKHLPSLIYYQIPSIEFYNTMWDHYLDADGDGENESSDVIQWSDIWADYIHPNTAGHRLAAGAITHYITKVAPTATDTADALPAKCFFQKANYYLGSVCYQSDDTEFVYTGEGYSCITSVTDDPNGGTASAKWKPWKLEKDGYITFTVKKCKSLSYIRAASVTKRTAEIYINGTLYRTDTAANNGYTDANPLAWTSAFYYFDGSKDITFQIKCTSDTPFIIHNLQFAAGE